MWNGLVVEVHQVYMHVGEKVLVGVTLILEVIYSA